MQSQIKMHCPCIMKPRNKLTVLKTVLLTTYHADYCEQCILWLVYKYTGL